MKRLIAGSIAALALAGVSHAQDWQRIGPDGGVVHALEVPDPSGNLAYVRVNGGLFRSDDRGGTWRLMPSPSGNVLGGAYTMSAFGRDDPDVVVLARHDGAWRSADGGQTWHALNIGMAQDTSLQRVTAVAVDPDDAERIAVFLVVNVSDGSFLFSARWLSEDGGQSGQLERTRASVQCGQIDHDAYDHVNAAVFHGGEMYYSHHHRCRDFWDDPMRPYLHLRRWGGDMDHALVLQMASSPNWTVTGTLAVVDGAILASMHGGALTRVNIDSGDRRTVLGRATTLQVTADGSLVAGSRDGLFRSRDLGETWQPMHDQQSGIPGIAAQSGPAAVFSSPTRWLVGGVDGVHVAADADGPWQVASRGLTAFQARTIAIDPDNEQRVWTGSMASPRLLMRTADGGASWQHSDLGSIGLPLRSVIVDPATTGSSGTVVYATGGGCALYWCGASVAPSAGIYRSRDSGASWEAIGGNLSEDLRHSALRQITVAPLPGTAQPRLLVTGHHYQTGIVLRSDNGGHTWTDDNAGLPVFDELQSYSDVLDIQTAAGDPRRVYLATVAFSRAADGNAVQRNGVFRSDDGGSSWTHRSSGLPLRPGTGSHTGVLRLAVHPANPDLVWAIAYDDYVDEPHSVTYKVYQTQDGGVTWNSRSTGLDGEQLLAIAVAPDNPQRVYVGGAHGVFHTANGGADWQRLGSAMIGVVTGLVAGPRHLFAASELGVQKVLRPGQSAGPEPCPESPPGTIRRHLDPHCSGRLWMPPR